VKFGDVEKSVQEGKITERQGKQISCPKRMNLRWLGLDGCPCRKFSMFYDLANEKERAQIAPYIRSKASAIVDLDPDTRREIEPRLAKALKESGDEVLFLPKSMRNSTGCITKVCARWMPSRRSSKKAARHFSCEKKSVPNTSVYVARPAV